MSVIARRFAGSSGMLPAATAMLIGCNAVGAGPVNLTAEEYLSHAMAFQGFYLGNVGAPRTYGVQFVYRYGRGE